MKNKYFLHKINITEFAIMSCIFNCIAQNWCPAVPPEYGRWDADTICIGADIMAADSAKDVVVTYKYAKHTAALAELFFVYPFSQDSLFFLFHNPKSRFPEEPGSIKLGKFPAGTPINFMYKVIDNSAYFSHSRDKKLFTGKNRPGVDSLVSELYSQRYGRCWSAVGRIGTKAVEIGFEDEIAFGFDKIIFRVDGATMLK